MSELRLNIRSLRELEFRLGFKRDVLWRVAYRAERYYRPFPQSKKGGGYRVIDRPGGIILTIQKAIHVKFLRNLPYPEHMHGGIKGRSPLSNARLHTGQPVVIALDIGSFFPSVTNRHIFHVWRATLGCGHQVSRLLTMLTTYRGHLPQGASTSTALANLVLIECDEAIRDLCERYSLNHGRFVDDINISGVEARRVVNEAVQSIQKSGFRVPHRKTDISGAGKRHTCTGYVVNDGIGVPREKRSKLRAALHHLRTNNLSPREGTKLLRSIKGRIQYVKWSLENEPEGIKRIANEVMEY